MDIHKPKPWRGWREFLKEYLIIVVGVLTALAAEQGVEWLRWQEKVHSAEVYLKRDLALTSDFASERVAIGRCLDGRLALLNSIVLSPPGPAGVGVPHDADGFAMSSAYRAPSRGWSAEVWDGMMGDGAHEHLDRERDRALGLLFMTVRSARAANIEEKNESTDLGVIAQDAIALTPDKRIEMLQHIIRLQRSNDEITSLSRQILRRISDVGYLPSLEDTKRRLGSAYSGAMKCRFADEDLKDRVLKDWFTLHR
jgi:hypothetical protein